MLNQAVFEDFWRIVKLWVNLAILPLGCVFCATKKRKQTDIELKLSKYQSQHLISHSIDILIFDKCIRGKIPVAYWTSQEPFQTRLQLVHRKGYLVGFDHRQMKRCSRRRDSRMLKPFKHWGQRFSGGESRRMGSFFGFERMSDCLLLTV